MNDKQQQHQHHEKKAVVVEKHYERRWLEAKSEMLRDAGSVIDFFVNMHSQLKNVAGKHKVGEAKLATWFLEQLPVDRLCEGDEDDEEVDEDEEDDE